eukprot:gb/GECG01004721.1/.p1 GENE.gb/GECG01004721.1/~~gb/GECG01004721.1/.p1  ORF type:complete len:221 (+),score=30.72 gb/GECG01004721.1/:1-663(+)
MSSALDYGKSIYDWWGSSSWAYKVLMFFVLGGQENKLRKKTVEACNISSGNTILDLCCGNGGNLQYLQERVGSNGKIFALDYSEGMLKTAQEQAKSQDWTNIEYYREDAAIQEYEKDSLDGAICTLSLTAVPEHEEAIKQVYRGLKNGKTFAVLDSKGFEGILSVFNPLVRLIFGYATNWDCHKDVIRSLENVFGAQNVHTLGKYNAGSSYIVTATKRST